ncbi:MAG: hypothetical protein RIC95_00015 [Vicingaceae bacterium]
MKKTKLIIAAAIVGLISASSLTSCKKEEGCTDPNANNYSTNAEEDDGSCTYPTINLNATGDGDVTGGGGSASSTNEWTNSQSKAELNMDITAASGGRFQIIVKDSDGTEVINETLTVGIGDDSKNICSASGTPGTWTVTVSLTDFSGDGSFSLSQGC